MRYYRINGDWITHLTGDFGAEIRETLKGLSLERLQKYPPPKLNGLPIGNEGRIFLRYVRGKSSQLDPSAFSRIYRSFGSSRDILRYLAFRQNEELSPDEWSRLIGIENIGKWISHKCLRRAENGYLTCQFSIVAIDGLVFVVDPINDHYNHISPDFLIEDENSALNGDEVLPFYHTYIGLDSLRMIESMEQHTIPDGGRYLDC